MIEAKASRTRERKETVFNEKKTVRDFGSSLGMSAMAEESVQARFTDYDQVNQAITVIAGTDTQKELGYLDGVTTILWVDGAHVQGLERQWSARCLRGLAAGCGCARERPL